MIWWGGGEDSQKIYMCDSGITAPIYQRYYREAMRSVGISLVEYSGGMAPVINRLPIGLKGTHEHVGRYVLKGTRTVRFVIDSSDPGHLASEKDYRWCDVYFKSNYWQSKTYKKKVRPIVNGNGVVNPLALEKISGLWHAPKTYDLVFISRVWGGVEHNVRLFEHLAKINCTKKLVAIFNDKSKEEYWSRLASVGVECTTDLFGKQDLWREVSSANLVFLRAGKHLCIPWRMVDLLCMGACIVLDSEPYPRWPVPLRNNYNYVHCGIKRPVDTSPAELQEYKAIITTIEGLLSEQEKIHSICTNNREYFKENVSYEALGRYIIKSLHA